jgi:hypothetical protein
MPGKESNRETRVMVTVLVLVFNLFRSKNIASMFTVAMNSPFLPLLLKTGSDSVIQRTEERPPLALF